MSGNIKFLSLQKAELEYEVGLRGGIPADNVQDLRKQIVKLSHDLPSEDILESHLDIEVDFKGAKESLIKSNNYITSLKTKFDKNLYSRTDNLLRQISHRLCRICPTDTESAEMLRVITSNYQSQYMELTNLSSSSHSLVTTDSAIPEQSESIQTNISVTCDRGFSTDLSKLKYDGKSCVRTFIQRVNEFIQARSIVDSKILSYATEIFVDDALHWYRSIRGSVNSWSELSLLLKQDFDTFDYDYRLMAEIRSRTQGERENITIYLSIMHVMFSRLSKLVPEDEKLEILLHNIRPCYASTLAASPEIKTIDTLRSLCLNYERFQSRLLHFTDPPKPTKDTLAPDLAYNRQSSTSDNYTKYSDNKFTNYSRGNDSKFLRQVEAIEVSNSMLKRYKFCPRCRCNEHSLRECTQPKFPLCFKCGKKDVIYPNCTNCHKTSTNSNTVSKNA